MTKQFVVQSFDSVRGKVDTWLRNSPNTSLSAPYRHIKGDESLSFFSEYLILAELVQHLRRRGKHFTREQIRLAMKNSEEMMAESGSDKRMMLGHLCTLSQTQIEDTGGATRGLERTESARWYEESTWESKGS